MRRYPFTATAVFRSACLLALWGMFGLPAARCQDTTPAEPPIPVDPACAQQIVALYTQGGVAAVQTFLEDNAARLLGPADERAAAIARIAGARGGFRGPASVALHEFADRVTAAARGTSCLAALPYVELLPPAVGGRELRATIPDEMWRVIVSAATDPVPLQEMLATSGFVADLDHFRAYRWEGRYAGRTLLGLFLEALRANPPAHEAVAHWLATQPGQTFGLQLLRSAIASNDIAHTRDFLGTQLDVLRAASPTVLADLAVVGVVRDAELEALLPPTRAALELLLKHSNPTEAALIQQVLAARSVQELPWDLDYFDELSTTLIQQVMRYDVPTAVQLFDQLTQLGAPLEHEPSYEYYNARESRYDWPTRLLQRTMAKAPTMNVAPFVLALTRDRVAEPVVLSHNAMYALGQSLYHAGSLGPRSQTECETICCMGAYCRRLGEVLPPGDVTVLHPALEAVFGHHKKEQIQALRKWQPDTPAAKRVYDELIFLLSLSEDPAAGIARYTETFADADIALPARLRLALRVANYEGELGQFGADSAIELLAAAYQSGHPYIDADDLDETMFRQRFPGARSHNRGYCKAAPRTDEWRARIGRLLDGYLTLIKQPDRGGLVPDEWGPVDGETLSTLPLPGNLLQFTLELERHEDARRLLATEPLFAQHVMAVVALLTQHDAYDLALEYLDRHGAGPFDAALTWQVRCDDSFNARVARLLPDIPSEEVRYLTELALYVEPDAEVGLDSDGRSRPAATVARFQSVAFSSPSMKRQTLVLLAQNLRDAHLLAEPLAEVFDNRPLRQVLGSMAPDAAIVLLRAKCRLHVERGEVAAVEQILADLRDGAASSGGDDCGNLEPLRTAVYGVVVRFVCRHGAHTDLATLAKFRDILRRAFTRPAFDSTLSFVLAEGDLLGLALAAVADDVPAWAAQAQKSGRQTLRGPIIGDHWGPLRRLLVDRDPPTDAAYRLMILKRMQADPRMALICAGGPGLLEKVAKCKLLTTDELFEHAAEVLQTFPLEGAGWAQLALLAEAEKRSELAAEFWETALTTPSNDAHTVWLVRRLIKVERFDDARRALAVFTPQTPALAAALKSEVEAAAQNAQSTERIRRRHEERRRELERQSGR